MIHLALLRHGHTAWNRAGKIQGRSDIPLDADARAQLSTLYLPAPWDNAQLWSSPLCRATQTAQLVSGRAPQTTAALTEMNWGAWEGAFGKTLKAKKDSGFRDIEDWGWQWSPPQGESPATLRDRVLDWALRLDTDSVAVCHIGIMRVLMAVAMDWHFDGPAPFTIKRNRLYPLGIENGKLQVTSAPIRLETRQ